MSVYTLDIDTLNTITGLNTLDLLCATSKYTCVLTSPSAQTNFVLSSLVSPNGLNLSNAIVCKREGYYTISYHILFHTNLSAFTAMLACEPYDHLIFSVVIGNGVKGHVYEISNGVPQLTTLFSVSDMVRTHFPSPTQIYGTDGKYIIFCPLGATIQFTVSNIVASRKSFTFTTQILEVFTNTDDTVPATITLTPVVF